MAAERERPLDLSPDERLQLMDMLARRADNDTSGRLEVEFARGVPIAGWLHVRFGASRFPIGEPAAVPDAP